MLLLYHLSGSKINYKNIFFSYLQLIIFFSIVFISIMQLFLFNMKKNFKKSFVTPIKNLFGHSLPHLNKKKFLYKQNFLNELNTYEQSLKAVTIKDLNEKFTDLKNSNKKLEALILLHNTTKENPQIRTKIENPQRCESEEETELAETIVSNKMEIVQELQKDIVKHNDSFYRIFLKKFEHRNEIRKTCLFSLLLFIIFSSFYFGKTFREDLVRYLNSIFHFKEEKKEHSKKMENISLTVDSGLSSFSKKQNFRIMKNVKERLEDVKGIDEVKDEIQEVVKMMKNPDKYEKAGAKLIKGILLVGKPGTGKTLLARALAGESGVNFIAMSASEFDKSLVGMGSKLLKDLFNQARQNQPCIIFIDEIDTLLHASRRSG
jgi:ATP-dependent Zn protease